MRPYNKLKKLFEESVYTSGWWILTSWDTHAKSQPRKQTWKLSLIHVTLCGAYLCNYPRTAHRLISSLTCTMIKASKALSAVDEQSPQAYLLRWSKLTSHFLLIWKNHSNNFSLNGWRQTAVMIIALYTIVENICTYA